MDRRAIVEIVLAAQQLHRECFGSLETALPDIAVTDHGIVARPAELAPGLLNLLFSNESSLEEFDEAAMDELLILAQKYAKHIARAHLVGGGNVPCHPNGDIDIVRLAVLVRQNPALVRRAAAPADGPYAWQ